MSRDIVFLPRDVPHGVTVSDAGEGRALLVLAPAGFEQWHLGNATRGHRFADADDGYARCMNDEPGLQFDDELDAAAQLVPRLGYERAERIMIDAARTHRRVADVARRHVGQTD